jgi:hypothetical protein
MKPTKHISIFEVAQALNIDFSPSRFASLDIQKINSLCQRIKSRNDFTEYRRETWSNPLFYNSRDTNPNRSQFFAIGNAINFRYWRLAPEGIILLRGKKGGKEFGGAEYMWRCLSICLERKQYPLLEASFLSNITEAHFNSIFSTDDGENLLEVGKEHRLNNLRDLGSKLASRWDGSFFNVVIEANNSLIDFCRLSQQFIAFDDPIYKLTMVNAIIHSGSSVAQFDGDPLPGIDYQLLKQLLRIGILHPLGNLDSKLRNQEILTSEEAYELRRSALRAFVIISEETKISGEILDNRFWMNRKKCPDINPVCLVRETASDCPFRGVCDQNISFKIPLEMTRYY